MKFSTTSSFLHRPRLLKGLWWLRLWVSVLMGALLGGVAQAANYTSSNPPPGCYFGGGGYLGYSVVLHCSTGLTIASGNTFTVTADTLLWVDWGNANINGAVLNNAGTYRLDINVPFGTFSASNGAKLGGSVIAATSISSSGAVTYTGGLKASGAISIGAGSTVGGAVVSTAGAVTLSSGTSSSYTQVGSISASGNVDINSYNRVTGDISAAQVAAGHHTVVGGKVTAASSYVSFSGTASVGGSITASGTYVKLGGDANIGGPIVAKTYVDTGSDSIINGDITAQTAHIDTGHRTTVYGSLTAGGTYVDIHSNANITGNITANSYVSIYDSNSVGGTVTAQTTVTINDDNILSGNVVAAGNLKIDDRTTVSGSITSTGGSVYVSTYTTVLGDVTALTTVNAGSNTQFSQCVRSRTPSTITLHSSSVVGGACCGAVGTCTKSCISASTTPPDCITLHHLELRHADGKGLSCTPSTVTVVACANSDCSSLHTAGVSGTLSASGAGTVNYPDGAAFVIPANQSSTTVRFQPTSAGTVTLSASASAPTPTTGSTCNFGSPSCTFTTADSGFVLTAPSHTAGTLQSMSIAAVKASPPATTCAPAFASVTRTVKLSCAYSNPTSGTLPVLVGGVALNALGLPLMPCDGNTQSLALTFDAQGVATTSLQYFDVGRMALTATHTGSGSTSGLSMSGTGSFVSAPASFSVYGTTSGPIRAGNPFSASVMARTSLNLAAPNFGKESPPEGVRLSWTRVQPTGAGASSGSFTGTGVGASASLTGFNNGIASVSDLKWSEVGTGDITATLASGSYLASGISATGSTGTSGAVGAFIPHHFDLALSQACGLFTYSGQPFTLTLTARNASGTSTANYNGNGSTTPSLSRLVTLSAASNGGLGSFASGTPQVLASAFSAGVATVTGNSFSYTNKLTGPASVLIRATDADGVSSSSVQGGSEGSVNLRSGRLRLTNAYGSERRTLALNAQAQYWSGKSWVLNDLDGCSALPTGAVALSNYTTPQGQASTAWTTSVVANGAGKAMSFSNGQGSLTLAAPTVNGSIASVGSVEVGLNLGSSGTDASCLGSPRPATTGAAMPWLRAQFGNINACAGVVDYLRDPSARATFGVHAPEVKRLIHATEVP